MRGVALAATSRGLLGILRFYFERISLQPLELFHLRLQEFQRDLHLLQEDSYSSYPLGRECSLYFTTTYDK